MQQFQCSVRAIRKMQSEHHHIRPEIDNCPQCLFEVHCTFQDPEHFAPSQGPGQKLRGHVACVTDDNGNLMIAFAARLVFRFTRLLHNVEPSTCATICTSSHKY